MEVENHLLLITSTMMVHPAYTKKNTSQENFSSKQMDAERSFDDFFSIDSHLCCSMHNNGIFSQIPHWLLLLYRYLYSLHYRSRIDNIPSLHKPCAGVSHNRNQEDIGSETLELRSVQFGWWWTTSAKNEYVRELPSKDTDTDDRQSDKKKRLLSDANA